MIEPSFWNQVFIWPILNVLILIYKGFLAIGIPGSLGFAIIGLTALVRVLLYPFTAAQIKSTQKMQAMKPHMDNIKEKHKHDTVRQQQEMAKLYKEHGVNPAAGCLPLLIQFPIFISLYNVLLHVVSTGDGQKLMEEINKIVYFPFLKLDAPWDPYFLGVNLGAKPSDWQHVGIFLLLIPILTGVLQYVQTKMMVPATNKLAPVVKKEKGKESSMDDFQNIMQKQMLYFFPVMIGFFSYGFPVGLSLYWNTFSIFGIIQQHFLNKNKK